MNAYNKRGINNYHEMNYNEDENINLLQNGGPKRSIVTYKN